MISSSGTLAGPFGFVGDAGYQQDSDSGLMLLGARYYDPSVGRFISRDPIRFAGGDQDLPGDAGGGGYKEYDVNPPGPNGRDDKRLVVSGDGSRVYYTWTHYGDGGDPPFVRVR